MQGRGDSSYGAGSGGSGVCRLPGIPDPQHTALFLDCDGTLAAFTTQPEQTSIEPGIISLLARLDIVGFALALVSGRSIEDLDRLFAPLVLPAAGVHGVERRDAGGRIFRPDLDSVLIDELARKLNRVAATYPGLFLERKPGAIALHYRARPDLGEPIIAFAEDLRHVAGGVSVLQGKMVVEFGVGTRTKGDAIRDFLAEAPFAGRTPVYAGDDVTDESAFAAVQEAGGIAIKVGPGETCASHRVATMEHLHTWLESSLPEAARTLRPSAIAADPIQEQSPT